MGQRFAEIAFTPTVRNIQAELGSRAGYAAMDEGDARNHRLSAREAAFIAARDSFYMASVSETGWPYVQHRGGPAGFVRVLDDGTLGFADFSGNRQYVSVGNVIKDDRVSLFFMDYPNRTRLKLLGRVRLVDRGDSATMDQLRPAGYDADIERGFVIQVEAFDWNCPQHITPRYTEAEVEGIVAQVLERRGPAAAAGDEVVLGDGPLELVVSGVRQLTPRVRAFELRRAEGQPLPVVTAGANLEVPVRLEDGTTAIRNYSLSSDPARTDAWEIAVLREDDGRGGSRAVHAGYGLGVSLRVAPPRNAFPLHDDARPAVLIAGGIGITPLRAMAHTLVARGTRFELHYAGRSQQELPFGDELVRAFGPAVTLYRGADGERLDVDALLAAAPAAAMFYVCGPGRLIDAVIAAAAAHGIDPERVRFERFAVSVGADARPIEAELRRSGRKIQVGADETVLDALLAAGIDRPYSCKAGNCRSCVVPVLAGEPEHRDNILSRTEREDQGLMLPCVSRAAGDYLVLDI